MNLVCPLTRYDKLKKIQQLSMNLIYSVNHYIIALITDQRLWEMNTILPSDDSHPIVQIGKYFDVPQYHGLGMVYDSMKKLLMKTQFFCSHAKGKWDHV